MSSLPATAVKISEEISLSEASGYFKSRRKQSMKFTKTSLVQSLERQLAQSPTANIPDFGFHVELRPGLTSTNATLQDMYGDSSIVRLKRTARALAMQSACAEDDEEGNHITSDKLPAITAPLRLTTGQKNEVQPARRSLLPPARTRMLSAGQPSVLLSIISNVQDKRAKELEKRREEMERLAQYRAEERAALAKRTAFDLKALTTKNGLKHFVKRQAKSMLLQIAQLLDRLALA
ncbi:MAG: hypothetical protein QG625_524 [Cyanobacteriota bacterium erpe_2018_sw_39hr_WHONDRS-SW48-000098_B_bin.30]|jgi:hypothetical protein|nr:hypothetical protein [Cyanobacteriota bacterium erpe_2018_sw_39hr_WHONDRS-SW48-000098_B_bin.30]